ncbi:hypothetical protein Btru_064334, partial [Bulinus truncatus]
KRNGEKTGRRCTSKLEKAHQVVHHHHTGRVTDGMYNVNDPQSYSDFDPDHINIRILITKNIPHTEMLDDVANRTNISPSHSSPQLYSSHMTSQKQQNPTGQGTRSTKVVHQQDAPCLLQMTDHSKQQDTSYESSFSSSNNMYNVSSQRTSHYQSADQLKSPATSEPGHIYSTISTNESSLGLTKHKSGEEPFLRAAPNSSGSYLHYGSLDRKRQNYRQDALRDLSPLGYRSHNVGYTERRNDSPNTGGYKDTSSPSHNPEDHKRHLQDQQVPHPAYKENPHHKFVSSNLSFNAVRCYSPRMYEGASGRAYHDIDVTHIHSKETHEHGLLAAHHTSSQPVFHRTERSISPVKLHHQENTYLRPHPPSGFDSHNMTGGSYQRTVESYMPVQPSETHLSGPLPAHHAEVHSPGHVLPHNETNLSIHHHTDKHIPIHHVDSHLPSQKPLQHGESSGHQYTHKGSPSSPHSPASYASSAVVTVTRLQPHTELTKPYEISDFYRYSEKLRRQRIIDQYQRQLMGVDKTSRSSSPLSVDSDGHSSHSGSTSSNPVSQSPSHHQSVPFSGRPPLHPYSRSASAPLHSVPQPSLHSMPPHPNQPLSPDGQITSSSSSYSVKSHGAGMNYAMQTSSVKVHQVHTATKHSVYQPPQPMTCNPVRNPPYKKQ